MHLIFFQTSVIPDNVRAIGLKASNLDTTSPAGILASIAGDVYTSADWKCTSVAQADPAWCSAGFDDSAWVRICVYTAR